MILLTKHCGSMVSHHGCLEHTAMEGMCRVYIAIIKPQGIITLSLLQVKLVLGFDLFKRSSEWDMFLTPFQKDYFR